MTKSEIKKFGAEYSKVPIAAISMKASAEDSSSSSNMTLITGSFEIIKRATDDIPSPLRQRKFPTARICAESLVSYTTCINRYVHRRFRPLGGVDRTATGGSVISEYHPYICRVLAKLCICRKRAVVVFVPQIRQSRGWAYSYAGR